MTEHDCDLCGHSSHTEIAVARRYIGENSPPVVCMNCGFVYVRARRTAKEVATDWSDHIYPGDGYSALWPAIKARLFYIVEWYDQMAGWRDKNVLEIGAGEGTFLEMVRDRGAFPIGIEPSAVNCRRIRAKDIFAHCGTVEKVGTIGRFDVVCVLWTLENCTDCVHMLEVAEASVKPNGRVLVATGSRILVAYKKPLKDYFSANPADTHAFRFSANTLDAALDKAGLMALEVNRFADSDWLAMVAKPMPSRPEKAVPFDDPTAVLQFFEDWGKAFP